MAITRTSLGDFFSALGGSMTMSFTSGTITAPSSGTMLYFPFAGEALSGTPTTGTMFWTVTDTFGDTGGTAWTLGSVVKRASVVTGAYYEESLVYTRKVGTGASNGTITVSAKQADNSTTTTGDGYFFFYPWKLTATGALSVDQTNNGQAPGTGSSTYAMSYGSAPTGAFAGSLMQQDSTGTSGTVPSGWTSQNPGDGHAAGVDIETAFLNGSTAANPSTWTGLVNSTNRLIGATVTVLEAGGATLVWAIPPLLARRRTLPRIRRATNKPTPPQLNPPIPLPPIAQRKIRIPLLRRGRQATLPPKQFNPPIPLPPVVQRRSWPRLTKRGHQATIPPPQFNPPVPLRAVVEHRVFATLLRRGHSANPVPAQQAAPTNPAFVSRSDQRHLKASLLRRGHSATPIPPQDAPLPSVALRRRLPAVRRGHAPTPTPPQFNPLMPLAYLRQRKLIPTLLRRGHQANPVPGQVVVPNPPYPTAAIRSRVWARLLRRGRKAERGWPQDVNLTPPPIVYPTGFITAPSSLNLDVTVSTTTIAISPSGTTIPLVGSQEGFTVNDPNEFIQ
jgi:hypothetical protein